MLKCLIKRAVFASQQIVNWSPIQYDMEKDVPKWMEKQIRSDLANVQKGDIFSIASCKRLIKKHKLMCYQIKRGRLSAKGFIEIERTYPITNVLMALAPKLPDMNFLVSFRDHLDHVDLGVPIFVFAKHPSGSSHILMPDFEALTGYPQVLPATRRGSEKYPWENKRAKCIWRGATTGSDFSAKDFLELSRSKFVQMSLEHPELIDARFTKLVQCKDPKHVKKKFNNHFGSYLSIEEQLQYKYQLILDGNTCPYSKLYWGLFSNALLLKEETGSVQWYYSALKPRIHYLPVGKNLIEMIKWSREHDLEAKEIANNSKLFAETNLTYKRNIQYLFLLLKNYNRLFP